MSSLSHGCYLGSRCATLDKCVQFYTMDLKLKIDISLGTITIHLSWRTWPWDGCVWVCVCVYLSYMCHLQACHCFQISSLQLYSFQMDFVLVPTGSYQSFELKKILCKCQSQTNIMRLVKEKQKGCLKNWVLEVLGCIKLTFSRDLSRFLFCLSIHMCKYINFKCVYIYIYIYKFLIEHT